jgi:WD40 repeat protein
MKRHSYKKNYNFKNMRKSKINGGRPPVADNDQCRVITTLRGHGNSVKSVAFHPTLPLLATGSFDHTAKLWRFSADASIPTCVATLEGEGDSGHSEEVLSVAFHPTLPLLATGSRDITAKLWSFNPNSLSVDNMSTTCVATLEGEDGHRSYVNSVAFHPKLPLLATGSKDNTAKLWSFNPDGSKANNMLATCVATLEGEHGHRSWVYSMAFHPTLPLLATGSKDNTAKLWSFNPYGSKANNMSATCVATLGGVKGHRDLVTSVAFQPKLPLLATSSIDMTAKLWSFDPSGLESGNMSAKCVTTLQAQSSFPRNCFRSVAFHPTLPILATGSDDSTAKLWSFNPDGSEVSNMSATCLATMEGDKGHSRGVTSVAFHPKLPLLATGSYDFTAKFWHCKILELYNDFTLYRKKGDISEDICNSLCYLCNSKLCKKNQSDNNNSNGYVVKLTNGDLTKDIHVHYNCLHFQLITNKTEIDNIPISSDTIQTILNIEDKMNALIGTDFYN